MKVDELRPCKVDGCEKKWTARTGGSRGMCPMHYQRARRGGEFVPRKQRSPVRAPRETDRNVVALAVLWGISESEVVTCLAAEAIERIRGGSR